MKHDIPLMRVNLFHVNFVTNGNRFAELRIQIVSSPTITLQNTHYAVIKLFVRILLYI